VRSATDGFLALAVAACLVACAAPAPGPSTRTPGASPSVGAPSAASTAGPTPSASASAPGEVTIEVPTPGHPWDGTALLDAMRASTRPGGVPDELETPGLAAAIAASVWTVDGTAWDTSSVGGYCGPSTCTIDIAGTHVNRAGEDLWTMEVGLASGTIVPLVAEVRSLPHELVESLDRLARALADPGALDSMTLATARWLPPPAGVGQFILSYRSGGEEGSCARELTLDAARGEILEDEATGC
jgi:hypothetical protein